MANLLLAKQNLARHSLMRQFFQLFITSREKWLPIMVSYLYGICEKTIDNDKESSIFLIRAGRGLLKSIYKNR